METFHDRGVEDGLYDCVRLFLGRAHFARVFKRGSTLIRHFLACCPVFSLAVGMIATPLAGFLMTLIGLPAAGSLAWNPTLD